MGSTPDPADLHRILQIYIGPTSDQHGISMIAMITMISMIFTGSPLIHTDLHDPHVSGPLKVNPSNQEPECYHNLIDYRSLKMIFAVFEILKIHD